MLRINIFFSNGCRCIISLFTLFQTETQMPYASVFISFTVKPRFNGPVSHRILDKKIHTPFLRYRIQFATDGICWNPLERDLTVESKFCKCFVKPVNQRMLYQINQALSHFTQQWWQNLTVVVSRTWGLLNLNGMVASWTMSVSIVKINKRIKFFRGYQKRYECVE